MAKEDLETARGSIKELEAQLRECRKDMDGTLEELEYQRNINNALEQEVTKLKAKLFDLMEKL